jgi:hypothetical protein
MNGVIKIVGFTLSIAAGAACGAAVAYVVGYSLAYFDMCDITASCGDFLLPIVLLGPLGGAYLGAKFFA